LRRMVILTEHDRVPCAGEADTEVGHDEDEVLSSNEINGQAPAHVLGIPKRYVDNLEKIGALPDAVVKRIFEVATAMVEKPGVKEGRYAVRINSGPGARQESLYLHVTGVQWLGRP
jgi:histidine triad (HIT) family protein